MKHKPLIFITPMLLSMLVKANSTNLDYVNLANSYSQAWFKTQLPTATEADLDYYLSFLTDDVAYQHLPYDKTDEREKGGKGVLRKGMAQWLGSNTG